MKQLILCLMCLVIVSCSNTKTVTKPCNEIVDKANQILELKTKLKPQQIETLLNVIQSCSSICISYAPMVETSKVKLHLSNSKQQLDQLYQEVTFND